MGGELPIIGGGSLLCLGGLGTLAARAGGARPLVGALRVVFWGALAMALTADRVKDLVETASAAGSAGVFVIAVFGLFTRFGGSTAAIVTMLIGALSWLAFEALEIETPYIAALALALLTYVATAAIELRTRPEPQKSAVS